jgi:serine phosphatase RsbU (regulator of sigma subunit)
VVEAVEGAVGAGRAPTRAVLRRRLRRAGVATGHRPSRFAAAVLVGGLAATAFFAWLSYDINSRNEHRLLTLKTKETGTVLQAALPSVQTSLAASAQIAADTGGDPTPFREFISGDVGDGKQFAAASLWQLDPAPRLVVSVGAPQQLGVGSAELRRFVNGARAHPKVLSVTGILSGPSPRLGYAIPSHDQRPTYAVYAESLLPRDRFQAVPRNAAFSDLRFAIYLGAGADPRALLVTNSHQLPIAGPTARTSVPFGAAKLTVVAAPVGQLGGTLSGELWWLVALVGGAFTLVAAFASERLVRQRLAAEGLHAEVRRLLGEQRSIAESLQRALLPKRLPDVPGLEVDVRYLPGVHGVEIGGDWYDLIPLPDGRVFFAVGDVSGRGVDAGTVMASLRFAIRGFVSDGHSPATVLESLTRLLDVHADNHFATVLCGVADVAGHQLVLASAGHLPPLIVAGDGARFASTDVGTPIGAVPGSTYRETTLTVPVGATLLAYTDGLVERRTETLDVGLQRLSDVAAETNGELGDVLDTLVTRLAGAAPDDDTAVLAMRWLQ